jgi:hypothetical protein
VLSASTGSPNERTVQPTVGPVSPSEVTSHELSVPSQHTVVKPTTPVQRAHASTSGKDVPRRTVSALSVGATSPAKERVAPLRRSLSAARPGRVRKHAPRHAAR